MYSSSHNIKHRLALALLLPVVVLVLYAFALERAAIDEDIAMVLAPARHLATQGTLRDSAPFVIAMRVHNNPGDAQDDYWFAYHLPVVYFASVYFFTQSDYWVFAIGQMLLMIVLTLLLFQGLRRHMSLPWVVLVVVVLLLSLYESITTSPTNLLALVLVVPLLLWSDLLISRPLIAGVLLALGTACRSEMALLLPALFILHLPRQRLFRPLGFLALGFVAATAGIMLLRTMLGADAATDHLLYLLGSDVLVPGRYSLLYYDGPVQAAGLLTVQSLGLLWHKMGVQLADIYTYDLTIPDRRWIPISLLLLLAGYAFFVLKEKRLAMQILLYTLLAVVATACLLASGAPATRYLEFHLILVLPPLLLLWPKLNKRMLLALALMLGIALWRNYEGLEHLLHEKNRHAKARDEAFALNEKVPDKTARMAVVCQPANKVVMWYGGYNTMLYVLHGPPRLPIAAIKLYNPQYMVMDTSYHYAHQRLLGEPLLRLSSYHVYRYNSRWADSLAIGPH